MPLHVDKDPTAFFSVVGAPYVHERRDQTRRRRPWRIDINGAAVLVVCTTILAIVLSAASGVARLIEVVQLAAK